MIVITHVVVPGATVVLLVIVITQVIVVLEVTVVLVVAVPISCIRNGSKASSHSSN